MMRLAHAIKNQLRYVKSAFLPPTISLEQRLANRPQTEYLKAALTDGDVFYDIGAAVGLYTVHAARSGKRVTIHAFEPHPKSFATLQGVVRGIGGAAHVQLHECAVSAQPGKAVLHMHPSPALSSLVNSEEFAGTLCRNVRVVSVDSFIALGYPPPNIVKIDAEGYEPEILHGMGGLLSSAKPRAIIVELENRHLRPRGHDVATIVERLKAVGYIAQAWYGNELLPISPHTNFLEAKSGEDYVYDFLFVPA